jgi:hypothetical protein
VIQEGYEMKIDKFDPIKSELKEITKVLVTIINNLKK